MHTFRADRGGRAACIRRDIAFLQRMAPLELTACFSGIRSGFTESLKWDLRHFSRCPRWTFRAPDICPLAIKGILETGTLLIRLIDWFTLIPNVGKNGASLLELDDSLVPRINR